MYTAIYLFNHVLLKICIFFIFEVHLTLTKSKDKLFWKTTNYCNLYNTFEAWYMMLTVDHFFKEILSFCSVYLHLYNLSTFELKHVFIAWNLDPASDKRVLSWFPGLPIILHRNQSSSCASSSFPIAYGFTSLIYFLRERLTNFS